MKVEKKTTVTVEMSERQWRALQFIASTSADALGSNFADLYETTEVDYTTFGFQTLDEAQRAVDSLVYKEPDET